MARAKLINVELAEMPAGEAQEGAETSPEESAQPEKATVFGGVAVADVTDDIRTALNLSKDVKGAVIADIDADSPAGESWTARRRRDPGSEQAACQKRQGPGGHQQKVEA